MHVESSSIRRLMTKISAQAANRAVLKRFPTQMSSSGRKANNAPACLGRAIV